MDPDACDERVEIHQPIQWSGKDFSSVIVRPVPLQYLAEFLDPERRGALAIERQRFANELVVLNTYTLEVAS
jgi:hypothetical protein